MLFALLICFIQSGCAVSSKPSNSVLKDALEIQIQITRRSLEDVLNLEESSMEVSNVKVESSEYIEGLKGKLLRVSGYLDLKSSGFEGKSNEHFNLLLERGEKGQSWRLAKLSASSNGLLQEWTTYPLPISN